MNKTEAINTVIIIFVLAIIGAIVYFFGDIFALSGPSDIMLGPAQTEVHPIWVVVGVALALFVIATDLFMVDKKRWH